MSGTRYFITYFGQNTNIFGKLTRYSIYMIIPSQVSLEFMMTSKNLALNRSCKSIMLCDLAYRGRNMLQWLIYLTLSPFQELSTYYTVRKFVILFKEITNDLNALDVLIKVLIFYN